MGEVDHIRSETSRRPHVYFKSHKITDLAKAFPGFSQPEKFKVYEPVFYFELFQCSAPVSPELLRDFRQNIVYGLCPVVYCVGNVDAHE